MTELAQVGERLGFTHVRTFLQSGNLVFEDPTGAARALETRLETATRTELGVTTDFCIRTVPAWREVVRRNPFPTEARDDPGHLVTIFLKAAPRPGSEARLRDKIRGRERARVIGSEAYVVYPDGIGTSKLTLPLVERALGAHGTGRNWNTVTKLLALAEE